MKALIVTAMILVRTSLFLFAINFCYHDISFPQFSPDYEILAPILVVFWEWFWIHFLTHSRLKEEAFSSCMHWVAYRTRKNSKGKRLDQEHMLWERKTDQQVKKRNRICIMIKEMQPALMMAFKTILQSTRLTLIGMKTPAVYTTRL